MNKIKEFFKNHHDKIILTIGAVLITGIGFSIGWISHKAPSTPIEVKQNNAIQEIVKDNTQNIKVNDVQNINTAPKSVKNKAMNNDNTAVQPKPKATTKTAPKDTPNQDPCQFVASSRGHKYYKADSSSAKSLSEKNKICFTDENSAKKAGYEPSASIK